MTFSFENLRQDVWKEFSKAFSLLPADKILLIDPFLLRPLDRVANMTILRRFQVTRIFKIADSPPTTEYKRIVYMVPCEYDSCVKVIRHLEIDRSKNIQRKILIIFVPKQIMAMTNLLERRGFLGQNICTTSLSFSWIQIDTDLVSLNLPNLYPDSYLCKDYCWPHFMGMELGRLIKLISANDLAPMGCRIHTFGDVANVVAVGMRLYCIQTGLVKLTFNGSLRKSSNRLISDNVSMHLLNHAASSSSSSSSINSTVDWLNPLPLIVIFSRDLDYITPLLIPMTFEALIHEVIGIDLGQVELPEEILDDSTPQKQVLDSMKMKYYKDVKNVHISRVHSLLIKWRNQIENIREDIETHLINPITSVKQDSLSNINSLNQTNTIKLKQLNTRLVPLLASQRELSFLIACLEVILNKMTRKERVEDLRGAQILLLQSGSGNSLPLSQIGLPPLSTSSLSSNINFKKLIPVSVGTFCGDLADNLNNIPIKLIMEWLTTNHGDQLVDGLRLLALNCILHDGLDNYLYDIMQRAILYSAGQIAFPMLDALNTLGLLYPRLQRKGLSLYALSLDEPSDSLDLDPNSHANFLSTTASKASSTLANATSRLKLGHGFKSRYNHLHYLLQLSHIAQTNRHVDDSVISPTYVYSGQHCPIIVRLVESIWYIGLMEAKLPLLKSIDHVKNSDTNNTANNDGFNSNNTTAATSSVNNLKCVGDFELISHTQLVEALQYLGVEREAAANLGLFNLFDASLTAAGYQKEIYANKRRLNAPLPRPLPLTVTDQPVVVVFPGGCTYGEVAALRFVANKRKWNLLVVTSCLLTSRDLLQQAGQVAMTVNSD